MAYRAEYKLGPRLFLAIILALAVGYVWACVENKRNPLDLLHLFAEKEPEPAPKAKPAPKPEPRPEPVPIAKPPAPKPEPAPAPKPELAPKPNTPGMYSAIEMSALFGTVEDLLRRGKFYDALEQLRGKSRLRVPEDQVKTFTDYEQRAAKYQQLLQETTKGITAETPANTRVTLNSNEAMFYGRILREDKNSVTLETLSGLRPTWKRSEIAKIDALDKFQGYAAVTLQLKKDADVAGLVVEGEPGKPYSYREKTGKTVSALRFFDFADYCARNGAGNQVTPLLDEALKRDGDLLATVHEVKGERMANVYLYYLQTKSVVDADLALDLLKKNYADTKAYREHVADGQTQEYHASLHKRAAYMSSKPLAKLDLKPTPSPQPAFTPPSPTVEPKPPPTPEPTPQPAPPSDPIRQTEPAPYTSPTAVRMPDGTAQKILDLVSRGDRYYDEAIKHVRASDPTANPSSWSDELRQAIALLKKANEEGYFPAQNVYGDNPVPQPLLDRVRETTQEAFMCRKRSVSTRR